MKTPPVTSLFLASIISALLAMPISAQTPRNRIGLGEGGGYPIFQQKPQIPLPHDVQSINGEVLATKGGLILLKIERFQSFPDGLHSATIAVMNYPKIKETTIGSYLQIEAKRIGVTPDGDGSIEFYDYFDAKAYRVAINKKESEELAAKKESARLAELAKANAAKLTALKANQSAADNGDVYGLLRMGERYRDGDGVDKDLAKARDYFTKAAGAGSLTAKEALEKLPGESK